jgi:hypothetical protein
MEHARSSAVTGVDLEETLGLPPLASKIIVARRSCVQIMEILALLAVLSHTHAAVKVRFLHSAADKSGTGRLCFQEFRSVAVALVRAACFLTQLPRGRWPKMAAVEVLATPIFEPYAPQIARDSFVSVLMSIGPLQGMLHNFARGAVDQHFLLVAKQQLADGQVQKGMPMASVLPQGSSAHQSQRHVPNASLYKVLPRRPGASPSPQKESCEDSDSDFNEDYARLRDGSGLRVPFKPKSSLKCSPSSASRRRGYFQAVPSKKEVALCNKLQRLQRQKAEVARKRDIASDSTINREEETIRAEIRAEVASQESRGMYRKHVDDMRNGVLSVPLGTGIVPRGCFWTASREHVACGGVLPNRCTRPLTPEDVQHRIREREALEHLNKKAQPKRKSKESPAKVLEELLSRACGLSSTGNRQSATGSRLTSSVLGLRPKANDNDGENSESLASEDKEDKASSHPRYRNAQHGNPEDVLLAFELYRTCYWRHTPRKPNRFQRDADIDTILSEAKNEPSNWKDCTGCFRTLHSFFLEIWPQLPIAEFRLMLKTIELSKRPAPREALGHVDSPQRQAETLRELIELFDAIDTQGSGAVPLEAVEKFLCGELLTARETETLVKQRQMFGDIFIGKPAGCEAYIDLIREHARYRFMTTQVEDHEDWLVTVPDTERRWVGLQERFSVKQPKKITIDEQPTTAKAKSGALYKIIGQRMEKLAHVINEEDADAANMEADTGKIPGGDLEVACKPGLISPNLKEYVSGANQKQNLDEAGAEFRSRLRLVRLYWRYLLGSAVQQQLRDSEQPSYLNLHADGQIDLVGFICILAHDQLRGLFPKGVTPTAQFIRGAAYAK